MAETLEEKKTEETKEETPEVEVETQETPESTEEESSEGDPDALTEDQLKEAQNLYKALRNPQSAPHLVRALMGQFGIQEPESKAERREAEQSLKDVVKAKMGKQYEFIADQLSDAIEAGFAHLNKTSEQKFAELSQNQLERDIEISMERLRRDTKGESKDLENRMVALSSEIPIGRMSVETYVKRLHSIAASERGPKSNPRQIADKINRNANDPSTRLRGTSVGRDTQIPDKKMSLSESVAFAFEQAKQKR